MLGQQAFDLRHFNPLPRKRENDCRTHRIYHLRISIHSLVRGRTLLGENTLSSFKISIHSLVRGRTQFKRNRISNQSISIHSLVRGRTFSAVLLMICGRYFNPLPRKRENRFPIVAATLRRYFNPLPRKRENSARIAAQKWRCNFNPLPRKRENSVSPR